MSDEFVVKRFGDVVPGDVVSTESGFAPVARVHDEHVPDEMFLLETENGGELKVSGNHLVYVVSDVDRGSAPGRLRDAKKLRKMLDKEVLVQLEELALEERPCEMRLVDMLCLLRVLGDSFAEQVVVRTAEAIGHIVEENTIVEDIGTGESVSHMVRTYDANVFAQQLLSVMRVKKFHKVFPTRFGRVVPVSDLVGYEGDVFLPAT